MSYQILKYVLAIGLCFCSLSPVQAAEYEMVRDQSSIEASVRYTVLGRYLARFQEYDSAFYFDKKNIANSFVEFQFQTASLDSGMPRFDRIVRSARLLNARKYPQITFRSTMIQKREYDYWVEGELDLHGVKRTLGFPFQLKVLDDKTILASGSWKLNRKSFNILWHPVLDKGGIFVGNKITIDWQILAQK